MNYSYIRTDEEIFQLMEKWKAENINQVAMDFECESNLHCYGEHLCLVQVFDGKDFFLIDPLEKTITNRGLKALLESKNLQKIWFDCSFDGNLLWKKHKVKIFNVYDLFREATALGISGGLSSLVQKYVLQPEGEKEAKVGSGESVKGSKKRFQQANWMKRPINCEQIEYALSDVKHLFSLKKVLDNMAKEKNLLESITQGMKTLPHLKTSNKPGYLKLPGYKRMNFQQKVYARHFFEVWDNTAKAFNWPPFWVMSKYVITDFAKKIPLENISLQNLFVQRDKSGERKKTVEQENQLLQDLILAKERAEKEINKIIQ